MPFSRRRMMQKVVKRIVPMTIQKAKFDTILSSAESPLKGVSLEAIRTHREGELLGTAWPSKGSFQVGKGLC